MRRDSNFSISVLFLIFPILGMCNEAVWSVSDNDYEDTWIVENQFYASAIESNESIIYVDANAAGGDNNGLSWVDAFIHLQDALAYVRDAGGEVNEIRAAQGIYTPDTNSTEPNGSGGRTATFQLINGVAIKGGYGGFGATDPNARDIETYETILSGDLNSDDDPNFSNNGENSYHVVTGSNTGPNAVLDGFTITAGNANVWSVHYYRGGGMYNEFGSPSLTNCTFRGNWGDNGCAMSNWFSSSPMLTNCSFTGNSGNFGGGIFNWTDSNPILTDCTFVDNSANHWGGGMLNFDCGPSLNNCTFSNNTAGGDGGGIYCDGSDPTLTNCTIVANSAVNGRALACYSPEQQYPSNVQLSNCILWNGGDEIWNSDNSTISIIYSDVQGGWPGLGNIDDDPCFTDENNGDYHLKSEAGRWDPNSEIRQVDNVTSTCIDAGNPGCPLGDEPEDGNNVRINMGAYGGTVEASKTPANWRSIADLTNDWVVDFDDLGVFVGYWLDEGECIPSDLNRSQFVNFFDFAIFAEYWFEGTLP